MLLCIVGNVQCGNGNYIQNNRKKLPFCLEFKSFEISSLRSRHPLQPILYITVPQMSVSQSQPIFNVRNQLNKLLGVHN